MPVAYRRMLICLEISVRGGAGRVGKAQGTRLATYCTCRQLEREILVGLWGPVSQVSLEIRFSRRMNWIYRRKRGHMMIEPIRRSDEIT
jgi:hypothetical protein